MEAVKTYVGAGHLLIKVASDLRAFFLKARMNIFLCEKISQFFFCEIDQDFQPAKIFYVRRRIKNINVLFLDDVLIKKQNFNKKFNFSEVISFLWIIALGFKKQQIKNMKNGAVYILPFTHKLKLEKEGAIMYLYFRINNNSLFLDIMCSIQKIENNETFFLDIETKY